MMLSKKMYTKVAITLTMLLGMGSLSFAGNTISDVPASASENRTIQTETSLYTESCDITQDLAFYDGSPVYLRIAQPKGPVNYVFDKAETYVRVYGDVFAGALKFPYITNMVPSTTLDTANTTILTVEAKDATFDASSMTMDRDEIAGQIVSKNMERSLILNNNGVNLSYYYRRTSDYSVHNGTTKAIINPNVTKKTACTNYYVARCGDGTIDNSSTNGISVNGDTIERHSQSLAPTEVCDDGALNGTAGKCKTDCTGLSGPAVNTGGATCTFTASPSTIEAGQTTTLSAGYTSGASATFSPTISGFAAFTTPTWNGTASATPTTTTTYTMNVAGANGLSGTSCTTTVNVTPAAVHLTCALSFSQNPVVPGQTVNVGWNVTNGNFVGTFINVNPTIAGWPHAVNANQYNGVTQAIPSHTGDYLFSFLIFNNDNTQTTTCTGLLHVIQKTPAKCSMTTTTPLIQAGGNGLINAQYSNSVLTTITPNIAGLNFVYPNRSKNNIQVHPTTTTTYTMIVQNQFGEQSKCGVKINVINTGIVLDKTLVNNVPYRSGDLVTFRIAFANHGADTINNVVLTDTLPAGLQYVSSQLYGAAPYTSATSVNQGSTVVQYSGFSLIPGQEGYVTIVGRFKGYEYANYTLNVASLRSDTSSPIFDSALFYAYKPVGNASITKIADKTTYYPGQDGLFTLAVTNNGPDAINNIKITDYRPQNTSCVSADSSRYANVPLAMTNAMNPYIRTYTGTLSVGETIYLYLTGHMSSDPACIGEYVNNAAISYMVNGVIQTGAAPAVNFAISTTPISVMDFEKRIIQYGNNSGDPVVFELLYHNNGSATITHFEVVDYWPGTLNFVSANPMSTTQIPSEGGSIIRWVFNTPLAPDGSGKIIINGTIK